MKAGELLQAEELYKNVLAQFPKNKKALTGYRKIKTPPQVEVDRLIGLFNKNKLSDAISLGTILSRKFPSALILYEILGAAQMGLGIADEAIKNYQKVLELNPKHTDALNNLGMVFYEQSNFFEAAENYQRAVDNEPGFADAHYNLGNASKKMGDLGKAIKSYRACLAINPNDVEVLNELGNALKDYGEFEQAIACYTRAIKIKPSLTDTKTYLDEAVQERKEIDKTIKEQIKQPFLVPENAQFYYYMAIILYQRNNLKSSIRHIEIAIKICPNYAEAYLIMGVLLSKKDDINRTIECYKEAIKIKPDYAEAYNNLGKALKDAGKSEDAIKNWLKATEIDPNYALAFSNMGSVQHEIGEFDAAIESYEHALKINPESAGTNFNLSLVYLHKENFRAGWDKYEWRWETNSFNSVALVTTRPRWSYSNEARVLLWAEQGIGDEIMFASIIPELYALCIKLIVTIDKRLIPLFRRSFPDDIDFRPSNEPVSEIEYDAHIPMGSLPLHFRQSIDSFKPTAKGWLNASTERATTLREQLLTDETETLIGISWHSTRPRKGADKKLIDLTQLAKRLHGPKVKLINLQYGDVDSELDRLRKESNINIIQVPQISVKNDIDGLAALIMACDKVISISNVTIHLAGALGKKAQLLLPSSSDWRWGINSNKNLWYESVHLYRQKEAGNWDSALNRL